MLQGSHQTYWAGFVLLAFLLLSVDPIWAQHDGHGQSSLQEQVSTDHEHHAATGDRAGWEGSVAGVAYSEFNHHLIGMLVLIIGLSELRHALAMSFWDWARFLLPGALLTSGFFLLVWSDHNAWPIGALSFVETFFGSDQEIFQHKSYGLLSLTVGAIELLHRFGQIRHAAWVAPLPLFAIIGGLMLFGHSHGDHPSAHKIAMDHAMMGTMAVTAGSSKLLSNWFRSPSHAQSSMWELIWPFLILLIGIQLLIYSE
jgi:putative copper resistance protein D